MRKRARGSGGSSTTEVLAAASVFFPIGCEQVEINAICHLYDEYRGLAASPIRVSDVDREHPI